jgi:hypothetical protein
MQAKLSEFQGCFAIELIPETIEDASFLTRMSVNSTGELRTCSAYAYSDGTFSASIVIRKRKRPDSTIPRKGARQ